MVKTWHVYTIVYYLAVKMKKILHMLEQACVKDTMLNEMSQEDKCHIILE